MDDEKTKETPKKRGVKSTTIKEPTKKRLRKKKEPLVIERPDIKKDGVRARPVKHKYEYWLTDTGLTILEQYGRDGLTDAQIYHNMGISKDSFYDWKKTEECQAIFDRIKKGRLEGTYMVENALFQSAMKGNVVAQIFYLKNRSADRWKDKQEIVADTTALDKLDKILGKAKKEADADAPADEEEEQDFENDAFEENEEVS